MLTTIVKTYVQTSFIMLYGSKIQHIQAYTLHIFNNIHEKTEKLFLRS